MPAYQKQSRWILFTVLVLASGLILLAGMWWWHQQAIVTISACGPIQDIAVSPDGQHFVSAEYQVDHGSVVHLRHLTDGSIVRTFTGDADLVTSVAVSPDGTILAASFDARIRLWALADGTTLQTLTGHTDRVLSIAFSPDGHLLASGSTDRTVRLWRVRDGALLQTLHGTVDAFFSPQVAFHPAGDLLAVGDHQSITPWQVSDRDVLPTIPSLEVASLAFSADGRFVIVGQSTVQPEVLLLQLPNWAIVKTMDAHANGVLRVATSPAGRLAASASGTAGNWLEHEPADPTIRIWDMPTGKLVKTMHAHNAAIRGLAFSPDGRLLVSGSADATIKIWQVPVVEE